MNAHSPEYCRDACGTKRARTSLSDVLLERYFLVRFSRMDRWDITILYGHVFMKSDKKNEKVKGT